MIRNLDCILYYNNRTEKLLKLEPNKIQKSDENIRAELTHIVLTRQHNAYLRLHKIYKPVIQL